MAWKLRKMLLTKGLGDQAHRSAHVYALAVAGCDTGALLSPMLESV